MNRRTALLEHMATIALGQSGPLVEALNPDLLFDLTEEPIYAIPNSVLSSIDSRMPGWFEFGELELEQHFTDLCTEHYCAGYFRGWPVKNDLARRLHQSPDHAGTIRTCSKGTWPPEFAGAAAALALVTKQTAPIHDQLAAYVGWLITNPTFLLERDALKAQWDDVIRFLRYFPQFPVANNSLGMRTLAEIGIACDEFIADFNQFFRRWQLKEFASWDLPIAIGANLGCPGVASKVIGVEDQPIVQLAGTIRLPTRFRLRELLHSQLDPHLDEWQRVLDRQDPQSRSFAFWIRLGQLHLLRNVLFSRDFPDRVNRHVIDMDWVCADLFGDEGSDSVRKARAALERRLS